MNPRVNMIMVGTRDVSRMRRFYEEGLGWEPWGEANDHAAMYKVGTSVMVFLDADYLAAESGVPAVETPKSHWAIFVSSKQEAGDVFSRAIGAGAQETSGLRNRDLGLYSGYFADPEGNIWEVVWSPHMAVGPDGGLVISGE